MGHLIRNLTMRPKTHHVRGLPLDHWVNAQARAPFPRARKPFYPTPTR